MAIAENITVKTPPKKLKKQRIIRLNMQVLNPPEPLPDVKNSPSHERLQSLAASHQPPQEWLEGDEEDLF